MGWMSKKHLLISGQSFIRKNSDVNNGNSAARAKASSCSAILRFWQGAGATGGRGDAAKDRGDAGADSSGFPLKAS